MNLNNHIKAAYELRRHRKFLSLTLCGSILVNIALAACLLRENRDVIIIPTHLEKNISIGANTISDAYLELLARDFVQTFLNINAANEEYVSQYILGLAHPSYYSELKQQLHELFNEIKTKQLSLQFNSQEMQVDNQGLAVEVIGDLSKKVGTKEVERKKRKYLIRFHQEGTKLTLKEFYEVADEKVN